MKDLNEGLGRGSRIPKDGNHSRHIAFLRKNFSHANKGDTNKRGSLCKILRPKY